jgi:hypothetical protein
MFLIIFFSSSFFFAFANRGAAITCMAFNNFLGQAQEGIGFEERAQLYALASNWSNGEVVQRGTGANYGEDGFLRPSFTYDKLVKYLYDQAMERKEIGGDLGDIVSRDWKTKFASALVPRGLENDSLFQEHLFKALRKTLVAKYVDEVERQTCPSGVSLSAAASDAIAIEVFTATETWGLRDRPNITAYGADTINAETQASIAETGELIAPVADALYLIVARAIAQRESDHRISSYFFTQPLPVDSVIDDFAVEGKSIS